MDLRSFSRRRFDQRQSDCNLMAPFRLCPWLLATRHEHLTMLGVNIRESWGIASQTELAENAVRALWSVNDPT
jgi:hypothetical protein